MNEFNFRVANAAPRAAGFEIGQNVGDTKTTYIYSYKTKYINGKSTGQKSNVDWDITLTINWPLNTFFRSFLQRGANTSNW